MIVEVKRQTHGGSFEYDNVNTDIITNKLYPMVIIPILKYACKGEHVFVECKNMDNFGKIWWNIFRHVRDMIITKNQFLCFL